MKPKRDWFWFELFTDSLVILTTSLLTSLLTNDIRMVVIAIVGMGWFLFWWRGR